MVAEVPAQFAWAEPYELEDDEPDGVWVHFARAIAIRADPSYVRPELPKLTTPIGAASLEKVKHGIRNLCTLLLAELPELVRGDFSWVENYKAYQARQRAK